MLGIVDHIRNTIYSFLSAKFSSLLACIKKVKVFQTNESRITSLNKFVVLIPSDVHSSILIAIFTVHKTYYKTISTNHFRPCLYKRLHWPRPLFRRWYRYVICFEHTYTSLNNWLTLTFKQFFAHAVLLILKYYCLISGFVPMFYLYSILNKHGKESLQPYLPQM